METKSSNSEIHMELEEDSPHLTGVISHQNGLKDYLISLANQWLMMVLFGWAFKTLFSVFDLYTSVEFSMRIFGKNTVQYLGHGKENQLQDYQLKNIQLQKCQKIHITVLKLPKNQLCFYSYSRTNWTRKEVVKTIFSLWLRKMVG